MKKIFLLIFTLMIILGIVFFFKEQMGLELKLPFLKQFQPISYLSYQDLIKLGYQTKINKNLSLKLEGQLNTPYIVNKWQRTRIRDQKPYLRIAQWNIARGINVNAIKHAFSNPSAYYDNYKKNIKPDEEQRFKKELNDFIASDIISLNEVDIGMPRTKYKNIVSEIASKLNYNYVFATEFIELAPIIYKQPIDPKQYLGLHGSAILSRYPIISTRIVRLPDCYNWFDTEIARKSPLEHGRRYGAKAVFKVNITNEPRRGGRTALVADIKLPNNEILTVVSIHLEDRCYPPCRLKQVQYLLENIKYLKSPVVIAGDFNTTTSDTTPTSVKKEVTKRLKDPHFIARQIALFLLPIGPPGFGNLVAGTLNTAFHYKDPAVPGVPVLFPNQERKLFNYLENFRFVDSEGFDFRGDSRKSSNGKWGLLANSNERQLKGFESTFRLAKPMGIAYFKLDWFFVKPKHGRFEPFNGMTLKFVNEAYPGRISDHDPITVDLRL